MRALMLIALAASASAAPCQMDPKFYRRSCEDPEMQAAMKAYQDCAAAHGAGVAPGYACVPGGPKPAIDCAAAQAKCRPDPALSTAPLDQYAAAQQEWQQCVDAMPSVCPRPIFPAHALEPAKPATPAQPLAPAQVAVPAKRGAAPKPIPPTSNPGYGQFGQALVNAGEQEKAAAAQPKAAAAARPAAPQPPPQGNFSPVLNQTAQPAFGPLKSAFSGNQDTQSWIQKKKRRAKPAAPKPDDQPNKDR